MARPVGVEPATFWSVVKRSVQLSYGRISLYQVLTYIIIEPYRMQPLKQKKLNFFSIFLFHLFYVLFYAFKQSVL